MVITKLKQDEWVAIEALQGALSLLSWIDLQGPLGRIKVKG
jgi:hypothetical protein